ncbi:hypothetical protein U746_3100 [Mycolicibacterium mucogenicum 261Sha1.1M5]|nr:hypothetical protein U746_3100 [Mycolicibacterium mucogenicum 261Sha1.1M5]
MKPPTPHQTDAFIDLARSLIDAIEAEKAKPLIIGVPAYRGSCRVHPDIQFPLRATRSGAQEDLSSHMNGVLPGGHTVESAEIPDWHVGLTSEQIDQLTAHPTTES